MSLVKPALNTWLRCIEKPAMARADTPSKLRQSFEAKARLFFHAPWGTTQAWHTRAGLPTLEVTARASHATPVILYIHGGAFIFGSPRTHAAMLARLCHFAKARAVLPTYRRAPEHPFPAALQDCKAAYLALLEEGVGARDIVLGGDSAGGALALTLLALLLKEEAPLPAKVFALSPLTDLTYSAPSITENAERDVVLPVSQIPQIQNMYLAGHDPHDPAASPLFADFEGAPPVFLTVGDTEILRDDGLRMRDRLQEARVDVTFELGRNLPHVWPLFHNTLPEARHTLRTLAHWIGAYRATAYSMSLKSGTRF